MKTSRDLDRLDRGTLRAWRVANIIGWWFIGAAIYNVGGTVVDGLLLRKFGNVNVGWQVWVAFALVSLFAAASAGWIVGRHVYRAPGTVGAATVLLPGVLFILLTPRTVIVLVFSALPAALATIAARIAWRRRPSALRLATGHR
jgi:hypothetical protein